MRLRTDPEAWARMFGGGPEAVEFVRQHLPALEAAADTQGHAGRAFTSAVRAGLWRYWRQRWRDDRVRLEDAQRKLEAKRARQNKASTTVDVAEALRRALQVR